MTTDPIIGRRLFTDCSTRDVFADVEGQYVLGDDGRQVYGVWLLIELAEGDAPLIVYASPKSAG